MRNPSKLLVFVTLSLVASLALSACGGGGGSSSPPPPPPITNASPGGIWEGSTSDGLSLIGLVTETGQFHFLQSDGVQYFCYLSVSGNAVSSGFTGITQLGTTFTDGSTSGSGTLTGTIAERSTLNGSAAFKTAVKASTGPQTVLASHSIAPEPKPCGSSALSDPTFKSWSLQTAVAAKSIDHPTATLPQVPFITGTFKLTYNALYDRDSSLATIAGNFREPNGTVVSVDASGNIFSQDATTGCVVNGKASIIDSRYNAYDIQYTFSSCIGELTVLNGVTFTGLGTLDNTAVPEQAVIAVTYQGTTTRFALIEVLDRT